MTVRGDLTDEAWDRLRPFLPMNNGRCGRAERHLDVLAAATHAHGWSHLKIYVESPPVLWVFPEGAGSLAVGITAERAGGRWAYRVSGAMRYPCDGPQRVAGVLSDVLRDRLGAGGAADSAAGSGATRR
ncbi:hypothetical protein ACFQY7_30365 [Actinomadura luteofluorescens]|uniref:Uncharacterized protein n=1 Tax=Actinomadura luteofluorescens TaxID=46163 RepID=A0A7Y9EL73_9ACTN|nr:hypothetical protein [Actinomadura luteofluorescens]NYD49804.1 hypothetical protein [Actinomadura luteofluorescens]